MELKVVDLLVVHDDPEVLQGIQHHEQGNVRLALAHWGKALEHDDQHRPTAARVAATPM